MLKKIAIAAGLLLGSFLTAWAASSTLSGLSAGGPITRTDLFYDVQTPGVGGVKVTGTQFLSFVFGNAVMNTATITSITSTQCVHAINGVLSGSGADCGTGSGSGSTSIVAGTNITTSGVVTNTTVNVVATPTFTSITTTLASVTGWLTAAGVNAQTATIVGNLTGSTANFSSNLTANIGQFPGFLTASGASLQTLTLAGSVVVKVRSSASAAVTASATTDYFLCLDSTTATITVGLPASPATGLTYLIKDCTGQAATHGIILSPSTGNIDGAANSILTRTFGSEAVTYSGSQWSIN